MANEGTGVMDGGAPSPEGAAKPATGNTGGTPEKPTAPARDYDKEIAGIRADLQKERKARQEREAEATRYKAEVEAERRRVQALAGVTPKSTEEQNDEEIRKAFAQKFPHLAGLTEEDVKALREMRETARALQQNTELQWQRHNQGVKETLESLVAKEIGGKLSERQSKRLIAAYVAHVENDEALIKRHEMNDRTLFEEFAKEFVEDFIEPARRKAVSQEVARQRVVPSGKDRGIVTHGQQKIDVNDPKAVEDFLVKGFKERGGQFGR